MLRGNSIRQALKVIDRDVDGQTTDLARQVMVLHMIREVEHGGPVAQMHVVDQTRLLERIDRPVHRRNVDRRAQHLFCGGVQRRRSEVQIMTSSERLADRSSRCRHSEAVSPQGIKQLAGVDIGHRFSRRIRCFAARPG